MDTSGFYKVVNGTIQYEPNHVEGPGFTLNRDSHADYSYPVDGWTWYDANTDFLQSGAAQTVVTDKPINPRHITKLAFKSRFTNNEAIAIDLASIGATVPAASMRRFTSMVDVATYIDLDEPATRQGLQYLETVGLLAAGRAIAILDTPTIEKEWYRPGY